ncbi:MAG: hypothetical protein HFF40_11895 [Lawsonibacter sp.]|jgi:transcriptional regulator with XRE-family HTH domain|nr:hypothetical protein [Lawsonibacter sp.]
MEELAVTLAERLRKLRQDRGLTILGLKAALKEKYGIDISGESLTNYEVKDSNHSKYGKNEGMNVKYLRCLADFYNVSTDYLLGRTLVRTTDTEIQAVSNYTGLSHRAIWRLHSGMSKDEIKVFNLFLDDSLFWFALHDIVQLKEIYSQATQDNSITVKEQSFPIDRDFYISIKKYIIDDSLRRAVDLVLKGGFENAIHQENDHKGG